MIKRVENVVVVECCCEHWYHGTSRFTVELESWDAAAEKELLSYLESEHPSCDYTVSVIVTDGTPGNTVQLQEVWNGEEWEVTSSKWF